MEEDASGYTVFTVHSAARYILFSCVETPLRLEPLQNEIIAHFS